MIASGFLGGQGFLSIQMNIGVELLKILNNPLSCKMRRDIIRNDREFVIISDGIDDAMSNGSGDSGG